ncbi:MAG: hypothetical protein OEZ34_07680 [Spirochaetia bacterium]|nr:hypothetical protein [Spirochaetia bacterium]
MKTKLPIITLAAGFLAFSTSLYSEKLTFHGPYSYKNISIYYIQGKDQIKTKNFYTLSEAMKKKKVKVFETEDVNNLSIQNFSRTHAVFIQSGDIVKGGKQDRVIGTDLILPPSSPKTPIGAFCVESDRWEQREGENINEFSGSNYRASSKDLKIAIKKEKDQSQVWSKVAENQDKLSDSTGVDVKSRKSQSSLQLTLENKKLENMKKEYLTRLTNTHRGHPQTVGYAFTINGEINSADVYASHALFMKMWPKLLDSSVTEAIGKVKEKNKKAPSSAAVKKWYGDAKAKDKEKASLNKKTRTKSKESNENLHFETYDAESGVMMHKNVIKK